MRKFTCLRPPFYTFLITASHTGRVMIFEKYNMDSANPARIDSG